MGIKEMFEKLSKGKKKTKQKISDVRKRVGYELDTVDVLRQEREDRTKYEEVFGKQPKKKKTKTKKKPSIKTIFSKSKGDGKVLEKLENGDYIVEFPKGIYRVNINSSDIMLNKKKIKDYKELFGGSMF